MFNEFGFLCRDLGFWSPSGGWLIDLRISELKFVGSNLAALSI